MNCAALPFSRIAASSCGNRRSRAAISSARSQPCSTYCGPVVLKKKGKWVVTAAGPTTSTREEPYQAGIIEKHGLRAVIGKGGMGEKTRLACQKFGCVYFHAIGGAAQVLAESIEEVENVYMLEKFGSPEAIWQLRVKSFPVVVTIDAHGNSLHKEIEAESAQKLSGLMAAIKK
jgi:fumarate hydratase class I